MLNDPNVDRFLSLLAIFLSPFATLLLSRWFNAREVRQKERVANTSADVAVFQAHLAAFRMRVEQLEDSDREKEAEIAELRTLKEDAERRGEGLEEQNGRLLRENYRLREQLDECQRRKV